MAKTANFDVMSNMMGLNGLNINADINEESKEKAENPETKEVKKENVKGESVIKNTPNSEFETNGQPNNGDFVDPLPVAISRKKKTVHKNFVITEMRAKQLKDLAKMRGQSENALFEDILAQIFGKE